jgi:hypothetical protein
LWARVIKHITHKEFRAYERLHYPRKSNNILPRENVAFAHFRSPNVGGLFPAHGLAIKHPIMPSPPPPSSPSPRRESCPCFPYPRTSHTCETLHPPLPRHITQTLLPIVLSPLLRTQGQFCRRRPYSTLQFSHHYFSLPFSQHVPVLSNPYFSSLSLHASPSHSPSLVHTQFPTPRLVYQIGYQIN